MLWVHDFQWQFNNYHDPHNKKRTAFDEYVNYLSNLEGKARIRFDSASNTQQHLEACNLLAEQAQEFREYYLICQLIKNWKAEDAKPDTENQLYEIACDAVEASLRAKIKKENEVKDDDFYGVFYVTDKNGKPTAIKRTPDATNVLTRHFWVCKSCTDYNDTCEVYNKMKKILYERT